MRALEAILHATFMRRAFAPAMFMAFPGVFLSVEEADRVIFFIIIIIIINLIYLINIIYLINLICKAPKQAMKRSILDRVFINEDYRSDVGV